MKLSAMIRDAKPDSSLKRLLHFRLSKWAKQRSHKTLHASDLTQEDEFCPREFALLDVTKKKPKDEFHSTALATTFADGHDKSKRLREDWLDGLAVGDWKCKACGDEVLFSTRPKTTAADHRCIWQYNEIPFVSSVTDVSCSPDILVKLPGREKLVVVEVKILDKDYFRDLKAPMAEHRWRTNLYLRVISESTHPQKDLIDTQSGVVLYIGRCFGLKDTEVKSWGIKDAPFSPFKEYNVERNDADTVYISNKALALKVARAGAKTPCGICPSVLAQRAQKCPVVKECFSGNFPGSITWKAPDGKPVHNVG